ncbi:MAG: pyridoxine 5'-phosphate synthase [Spirochaetes bacterium]|jgi:pyridoxine 5-phosphate synthase|nr:pyridoxine 5'-phosphate synthase [Spirochaetota bacterium]
MKYPVLGVNIDHVATLSRVRGVPYPDVVEAAKICEQSDIYCITAHLREDRRHIQDNDIYRLKESVTTRLNMEMAISPDVVEVALDVVPYMVTIVPEKREELTTEGGLNLASMKKDLQVLIPRLNEKGIIVSLFIEPNVDDLKIVDDLSVPYVEFHTGSYANAIEAKDQRIELQRLYDSAEEASGLGIFVNAGHGLTCKNIAPVLKMSSLREVNIGHSIISRSVFIGMHNAVEEMLAAIRQ